MDWKQILSLSDEDLSDDRKEEIYAELVKDQKFDGRIAKKLFPLCLTVLKHKGQQVEKQREEMDMFVSSDIDLKSTLEQVEKQKKSIAKFETERAQYKSRIKELTDEMAMMHGRELQGSDEDSPDQLSDIDRQQELMANISMKNKHIRRLLRDIEKLEEQSSSQLIVMKDLKANVEDASEKITALANQLEESTSSVAYLEEQIAKLKNQIHEQEGENQQLIRERKDREKEMEAFSAQLEERILMYKNILDDKQRELDEANGKYTNLIDQLPGIDIDSEQSEIKRLLESLKERDELIATFEEKINQLSAELVDSTSIITKINNEKNEYMKRLKREKTDKCCEEIQAMLERSQTRCLELQEMLELAEDDNILKAKQAFEAIETMKSYENSEDGLADALKKIYRFQESLHQRDKQIHELVVELNSQNEIVAENAILRKRLGVPEDEIIETKAFLAKQKKFGKINDRLMLKLRASEEMRLQLKIDKNDLKRKIAQLESQTGERSTMSGSTVSLGERKLTRKASSPVENKQCESCLDTYNVFDSVKFCKNCIMKQNSNLCDSCVNKFKVSSDENIELIKKIAKLEIDQQSVTEENENLRVGLNEILEKLRDYEGSSERTIINPATLEKLIYILNLRNARNLNDSTEPSQYISKPLMLSSPLSSHSESEVLQLKLLVKDLSEKNEEFEGELEKMKILERNYEELVKCSELCDDDKNELLLRSLQRCHEFETNLKGYERKIEFLKSENDNLYGELKVLKLSSMELINDLKMEILQKSQELNEISVQQENGAGDEVNVMELKTELQFIRSQLNGLCFNVLKNIKSIDSENILKIDVEKLLNVTILENDFSTSFITRQEFNTMKSKIYKMQETIKAHESKENHLEELTKVTQSQLKSQQLMLSQFSDDEISARHLIVDLQSQSHDNYLLAKTTRELKISKEHEDQLKLKTDELQAEIELLQQKLSEKQEAINEKHLELKEREGNNLLKIQYLQKSMNDLCNHYSSMTPVYLIADFVRDYAAVLEMKKQLELDTAKLKSQADPEVSAESIIAQLKDTTVPKSDIEAKIEIIKHKSSCDYLKQQLEIQEITIKDLHNEVAQAKMNEITNNQHWNAIRMLFGADQGRDEPDVKIMFSKESQTENIRKDCATNTDELPPTSTPQDVHPTVGQVLQQEAMKQNSPTQSIDSPPQSMEYNQQSLQSQLKKALILASSRSALLIETENRLSETHGRIKVLEKNLDYREKKMQKDRDGIEKQQSVESGPKKEDHTLSITIGTLQNLLLEKDTTLSRYQELLKSERQHHSRAYDEMTNEAKQLKKTIDGLETTINDKGKAAEKLKSEISELEKKLRDASRVPSRLPSPEIPQARHVTFNEQDIEVRSSEMRLKESQNEMKKLEQQMKDLVNTERQLQNVIREKDSTIKELNVKLRALNDNFDTLSENFGSTTEIDQLRDMLEEKDKHIQDLTETLNQFHDDQQKYINDSAINSAEQVHLISADLNRSEATNRVLKTQLEAMKRQITSIQQREKQAREMIKTLKNQLIRRPVISIKSDKRPTTAREEQLQKKVHDLENELLEVKDELRRQTNINDNKKAKNAAELGLWDKQKRYQEMSEKLKAKLTEKEIDFERMKANFQIAKNNITRLERERTLLENKMKSGRYLHNVAQQNNCTHCHAQKYPVAETPTTATSDTGSEISHELISALKSRIESQQRRIIAMELDGRGSNALATEMERLQEHLSSVESQNIRLEARNIQLQLDYDQVKQNDSCYRQEARIKHLEDYILVLKDELAQCHAKAGLPVEKISKYHDHHHNQPQHQAMEQTILTLKRVIEKLKAENKYLKDSKIASSSSSVPSTASYMSQTDRKKEELFEKLKIEHEKLQRSYNDVLGKISALEIELQLSQAQSINVSCPHCSRNLSELATQDADVLSQQLQQKTALLEKAKTLLNRAAAKEKHLREQIIYLKKRVCDLEGVPVISEENSESG